MGKPHWGIGRLAGYDQEGVGKKGKRVVPVELEERKTLVEAAEVTHFGSLVTPGDQLTYPC